MFVGMTRRDIGDRYYRAMIEVKPSKPYYTTAMTIKYLLYTYRNRSTEPKQQAEYNEKYNAIVDMLEEYVKIERHARLLSRQSKWVVVEFNIPQDICDKLGKIERKELDEAQRRIDDRMRNEELREQERKAKINENIDKLL